VKLTGSLSPEYTVIATVVTAAATTSSCVLLGEGSECGICRTPRRRRSRTRAGRIFGGRGDRRGFGSHFGFGIAREIREGRRCARTSPGASASGSASYARRRTAAPWTEAWRAMSDVDSFGVTNKQSNRSASETTRALCAGDPRARRLANRGSPRTCRVRVAERRRRARECAPRERARQLTRNCPPSCLEVGFLPHSAHTARPTAKRGFNGHSAD
jgi:hypothetical protein